MDQAKAIPDLNIPSEAVFTVSSQITIAAPASHVFKTHCNSSSWPEWNSFVPRAKLHPSKSSAQSPEAEKQAGVINEDTVGWTLLMDVKMTPDASVREQKEIIKIYEEGNDEEGGKSFTVCWEVANFPKWSLRGTRTNEVVPLGEGKCLFKTWEYMAGPLAYVVKQMYGATLQERMQDWCTDLKGYAEKTWKETQ